MVRAAMATTSGGRCVPNTALVLDVLRRVEAAGATWAPRARGIDDGYEVLSWLDGDTPTDATEIDLDALVRMVRELHDLTAPLAAGFVDGAECLIHDDLQPRNVVVRDGRPVGLIDWEQARPGRRIEDVADLCWSFVEPVPGSDPVEIGRRWRGVLDTYGLDDPADRAAIVPTALARMAGVRRRHRPARRGGLDPAPGARRSRRPPRAAGHARLDDRSAGGDHPRADRGDLGLRPRPQRTNCSVSGRGARAVRGW